MNLAGCTMERLHGDADLVVYRARGPALDGPVLVLTPQADGPGSEVGQRFEREHALAAQLEPAWAARPLRVARHEGRAALVLSDPGGTVLASALGAPLPVHRALGLARGLAQAVREVHGAGLIHGDIRPANILVGEGDRLWLTGFGCAVRRAGLVERRPAWALAGRGRAYVAPEWLEADPSRVDERADLYSLGVTLYEMLTGELPFGAGARPAAQRGAPAAPSERAPGVPPSVDGLCLRLLAADPDERCDTAECLLRDLQACLSDTARERRSDRASPEPERDGYGNPDVMRSSPARLIDAIRVLSRQVTPQDIAASLVRLGVELSGAVRATLVLLDSEEPYLAARASARPGEIEVTVGVPGPALDDVTRAALDDAARTGRTMVLETRPAVLSAPLIHDETLAGVLRLEFDGDVREVDGHPIEAADALARQGATSLATARHYEEIARREALLNEGERLSHVGSWSMDLATGRLSWSPEHYRILGLTPDPSAPPEIEGFIAKLHPDDRQRSRDIFAAALREEKAFELDFRIFSNDGQIKHVHSIGRPVADATGRVTQYVGALMDVTRRRLAEERLQQARAELAHVNRIAMLGELVASIAHEVSQPIGAGVTNCEAALRWLGREEPDLVEVENAVRRAVQNGRRAGEVVNRLRALVRNSPPALVPLDLNDVVHEALPIIQQELSRRDVTLELGLAPSALPIAGDLVQLQQVMINLVVNGAQAMEDVRDRRRVVRLTTRAGDQGDVRLVVSDTGPGIDPQTRERLFNAFFTTKANGMGIGLSICRSIVEAHAGAISATSGESGGATFEVRLPCRPLPSP